MNTTDIRQRFTEEQRTIIIDRLSVALYYMATPLVLGFCAIDYFFRPEWVLPFFKLRLWVIPTALLCYKLYALESVRNKYYALPAHLFGLFLGVLNSYLAMCSGAEHSPYYAGLNLVGIGALTFLPLKLSSAVICATCIYAPYFAMLPLFTNRIDISAFVPHSAFMLSTIFLGTVASFHFRKLAYREIESRLALQKEIVGKEKIIEKKTQEGVYLESLARQFSPQVIDAIKSGEISVDKETRKEITVIFVDSTSSTTRSSRLDHDEYLTVIKDFYTRCTKIFLTHDITTGTFLGDGLMAFVNAPKSNPEHQMTAVNASLEILKVRDELEGVYLDRWKNKFNIRIGINSGFAQVGFFPSQERGAYTVIGNPVNLAARLCSVGNLNTIAVTKAFLRSVAPKLAEVDVNQLDLQQGIKGLEGEHIEIYSITPRVKTIASALLVCKLCKGAMAVTVDLGDSVMIKCTACNRYTDIVEKRKFMQEFIQAA